MNQNELKKARSAYRQQQKNCRGRKDYLGSQIEMRLTFEEWLDVWMTSGKWSLRGRGTGSYCMSRINDLGHYELGNVKITLNADNIREATPRMAASLRGKPNPKLSASKKGAVMPWLYAVTRKPCTIDGIRIFPSRISMVRELGRPATRQKEFRYV